MLRLLAYGLAGVFVVALIGSGFTVFSAQNTTPGSSADYALSASTAQDLAPPECAGMGLTNVVSGSGVLDGTAANDLITGSGGIDIIDGKSGADCIVAGAGNDDLQGGSGDDVLLGGGGDDVLNGGGAPTQDTCYGGGQPGDTFTKCDIVIP